MSDRKRIHLVDDEESVRRSTSFMLRTSGYEVETYASGMIFLEKVEEARPGCILLDVRMPGMDGIKVQAELSRRCVDFPVIVLTGHGDVVTAVAAMKGGAVDFLEKPFDRGVLLDAIERSHQRLETGEHVVASGGEATRRIAMLSPREQDVLRGLVRGHPNKTIAYDLGISPRTVEVHRANAMAKLEARSLSEALRVAFAAGLDG
ncbi:response regulator transcription factor [Sphingomonas sp. TDK1]|uniref:response regulator transcription factor n=1 Tax=Sphingomonas sp. TDK1 TaxID=453247 RepID=UPI0007D9DFAE|nr:response regulator [Sphingomonas sp. TDK1]OAN63811.1 DNA-binding response regulator [Sphingomonas sp. TDK1]